MATETSKMSKTAKLIIGLLIILVAILFWLVLREPARQANSFLGDSVSIRQDQDKIQWKSSNSDWQTITTVSQLATGQQGKPGKDGSNGKDGDNGKDGQPGAAGKDGSSGTAGAQGAQGVKGDTGAPGSAGKDGAKGETGATGANGANGTDGATGATGLQGAKGDTGATGAAGANGANGVDGAKGDTGATGAQGAKGDTGATGAAGTNGTNGTNGNDGREIELQKDLYYIQWRYVGEAGWRNLIAYSDLKGEKGDRGDTGLTGATGPANNLSIGTVNRTACTPTATITGTTPNQTLSLGIPGLPTGGTAGQILQKSSNDDCDTVWANQSVIVGAGRPDITNTMDASTQAKVTSATSGTEFRSTDGPQGAWVWMKQGSKWVVTQGDTGWRNISWWGTDGVVQGNPLPGQAAPEAGVAGFIRLRRTVSGVQLWGKSYTANASPGVNRITLPAGFTADQQYVTWGGDATGIGGFLDLRQVTGPWTTIVSWQVSVTNQNWPATLPGSLV